MGRYVGPVCKLCRREKQKLFLKGQKCASPACPMDRRPYPPGEHGRGRTKDSEYMFQLREKQKARRIYGVYERQFRNYYKSASQAKGVTGDNLLRMLELRLDNVVFRGGFAESRSQARQLVCHGHFIVNGRKVTIPSYSVRPGDEIRLRDKSKDNIVIRHSIETLGERIVPAWLETDNDARKIRVLRPPERGQIEIPVEEQLIVELYSK